MKKAAKKVTKKATKRRAETLPGVGRLNGEEAAAMVRRIKRNMPKVTYRRGPNGIEILPEDTASGKGLISFRFFPPYTEPKPE